MINKPSITQTRGRSRLLNVQQVRERLQCSRQHVYNLVNNGTLVAIKIGQRRGIRIREDSLERLLSQPFNDVSALDHE